MFNKQFWSDLYRKQVSVEDATEATLDLNLRTVGRHIRSWFPKRKKDKATLEKDIEASGFQRVDLQEVATHNVD